MWKRSQNVLMTEAAIRAEIPADLRYVPPSKQEAKVEAGLQKLALDVYADPLLASPMLRFRDLERYQSEMKRIAPSSEWMLKRIDSLAAQGLPATPVDISEPHYRYIEFWHIYRVLELRGRALAKRPARDLFSFARMLRMDFLRRGGRNSSASGQGMPISLAYFGHALAQASLTPEQNRALLKILPTDEELIRVQQDQVRYDFESEVVANLNPIRTFAIVNPKITQVGDYRQYIVGRLDVPATLDREIAHAEGVMSRMRTGIRDPRIEASLRERRDVIRDLPWKKSGEDEGTHRMRELQFRVRLAFHPNPLGALVFLGGWSSYPDWNLHERTWLALTRAKLHLDGKVKGPLPRDPFANRPIQYDASRGILWSVGRNRHDDGGKRMIMYGEPDAVVDHPAKRDRPSWP